MRLAGTLSLPAVAVLSPSTRPVELNWDHIQRLTGEHGLFEHALFDEPRVSHGYTTDDNARALVVLARFVIPDASNIPYLDFVLAGGTNLGWHNRMSAQGAWTDLVGSDDAHGRALWGLGEALRGGMKPEETADALRSGLHTFESPHLRAITYATLGALAAWEAGSIEVAPFLEAIATRYPSPRSGRWAWPEPRLSYANARIPEAMIRLGAALDDDQLVLHGLDLLDWLINLEFTGRHFSFTPTSGRGPNDPLPAFDQQPIEAWAMVDACHAADLVDGSSTWSECLRAAAEWFLGRNDSGISLYNPSTGAGFDGLSRDGVNLNRGAESTLAALGALGRLIDTRDMVGR